MTQKQITRAEAESRVRDYLTAVDSKRGSALDKLATKFAVTTDYLRMISRGNKPVPAWLLLDAGVKKVRVVTHQYIVTGE